jgi:hypothetical protein
MNAANAAHTAAFLGFTDAMPTPRPLAADSPSGGAGSTTAAVSVRAVALGPADSDAAGTLRGGQAVPILPSGDLDRALACYRYLGFTVLGRAADYLRLALGPVELHLYLEPALDPLRNGSGCYLRVPDPAALRVAWSDDGVNCLDLPDTAAYGTSLFAVIDSDGNTLRIGPLRETGVHPA